MIDIGGVEQIEPDGGISARGTWWLLAANRTPVQRLSRGTRIA